MRVKCLYKTGADLRPYEKKPLQEKQLGRFGTTSLSVFGELSIGREYLVMGVIVFETYQAYLIDDDGLISACPCQLFDVIDNRLISSWQIRGVDKDEDIYPYVQLIMGYPELCSDKNAYEKLIVEKEDDAQRIYFRRKIELEHELANALLDKSI